jgi:hypothetical protein
LCEIEHPRSRLSKQHTKMNKEPRRGCQDRTIARGGVLAPLVI